MDFLRGALEDTPSTIRLQAVVALRELGPLAASAKPELEQAAQDGTRDVRKAAKEALQGLQAEVK